MSENDGSQKRVEDDDIKLVSRAAIHLSETFDTVQIICTRHVNGGNTIVVNRGVGNWFARYGSLKDWIVKEEQTMRLNAKPDSVDDDDEDNEG